MFHKFPGLRYCLLPLWGAAGVSWICFVRNLSLSLSLSLSLFYGINILYVVHLTIFQIHRPDYCMHIVHRICTYVIAKFCQWCKESFSNNIIISLKYRKFDNSILCWILSSPNHPHCIVFQERKFALMNAYKYDLNLILSSIHMMSLIHLHPVHIITLHFTKDWS